MVVDIFANCRLRPSDP